MADVAASPLPSGDDVFGPALDDDRLALIDTFCDALDRMGVVWDVGNKVSCRNRLYSNLGADLGARPVLDDDSRRPSSSRCQDFRATEPPRTTLSAVVEPVACQRRLLKRSALDISVDGRSLASQMRRRGCRCSWEGEWSFQSDGGRLGALAREQRHRSKVTRGRGGLGSKAGVDEERPGAASLLSSTSLLGFVLCR